MNIKTTLLTFADPPYEGRRGVTLSENGKIVDKTWNATPQDIDKNFYEANISIFSQPRGFGYWLWKPYLILDYIEKKCEENEILIYCDAGDFISVELLEKAKKETKDCFFIWGAFLNYKYTKRDCFILMGCDEEKYWNSGQTYGAVCFFRKTELTISFLKEWLHYSTNPQIITDSPNIHGENIPGFIDHRHDQSILTNLTIKHNMFKIEQRSDNPWNVV